MNGHADEHEEFLLTIAAGELDPGDPTVQSRRSACEVCSRRIDAVLAVKELLHDEARDAEKILAMAERMGPAPGEERILALADHPEIRGTGPRVAPRRTPLWPLAAAAAGILAVLWVARSPSPGEGPGRGAGPDEPRLLGESDGIAASEPIGPGGFERFAWTVEKGVAERARSYTLVVEGAGFFEEIGDLDAPEWSDATRTQDFPDSIEWWVEAYDATGALLAKSARVAAQRSP